MSFLLIFPAVLLFFRILKYREARKLKEQARKRDETTYLPSMHVPTVPVQASEDTLLTEDYTSTHLDYDEHRRCRKIEGRLHDEISHLKIENGRLQESLLMYETAEPWVIKRTCHVPVKNTKNKTILACGDQIIVFKKTLKPDVSTASASE